MITHRRRQRTVWVVCATTVLAVLSACAPAPGASPSPSVSPTPTFATEEEAFAAAEKVYRAYNEAQNRLDFQDPHTFEALSEYTSREYFARERKDLSLFHAEGVVRGGQSEITWFELISYEPGHTVIARTCTDIREVTYVDPSGESIVPADRVHRYALDVTFTSQGSRWVIASSASAEDLECPSS